MKAAILYKANTPLEVVEVEQQGPQAGEARVRVMATGVCHSDWHIMNGDWTPPLPMVLGHQAAGQVEEAGPGARVWGCARGGCAPTASRAPRPAGAHTIIGCDLLENKLAFARRFGAT